MKTRLILLTAFLTLNIIFSQTQTSESTDPREIFKQRIAEIKSQKENQVKNDISAEPLNQISKKSKAQAIISTTGKLESKIQNMANIIQKPVYLKIFILLEASLLAAIVVVYRRRKNDFKVTLLREVKINIKKLREERVEYSPEKELEKLRKRLRKRKISIDKGSRSITSVAKNLSISKGEVYLAAKLNMMARE